MHFRAKMKMRSVCPNAFPRHHLVGNAYTRWGCISACAEDAFRTEICARSLKIHFRTRRKCIQTKICALSLGMHFRTWREMRTLVGNAFPARDVKFAPNQNMLARSLKMRPRARGGIRIRSPKKYFRNRRTFVRPMETHFRARDENAPRAEISVRPRWEFIVARGGKRIRSMRVHFHRRWKCIRPRIRCADAHCPPPPLKCIWRENGPVYQADRIFIFGAKMHMARKWPNIPPRSHLHFGVEMHLARQWPNIPRKAHFNFGMGVHLAPLCV